MKILKPYDELIDTYPLLRLVIPLAIGISLGEWCGNFFIPFSYLFLCIAAVAVLLCIFIYRRRGSNDSKYISFHLSLSLGVVALGITLQIFETKRIARVWSPYEQNFRAMVLETPKEGGKAWQATVRILGGEHDDDIVRLGLMKRTGRDGGLATDDGDIHKPDASDVEENLKSGDVLLFHSKISKPRNLGNPSEFDFARWLRQQGISGTAFCFPNQWKKSKIEEQQLPLRVRALRWRDGLVQRYADFFEGRDLAVLSAMTLGDKSHLDSTTRDVFSHTGVSHVLALSGLHLSILFFIYQTLVLSLCRRRRWYLSMSFVGVVGLWTFVLLAGLPLSLVRAAVMFSVLQLMGCLQRDSFSINNLALAALLVLLVSPQSLFDVGFQLSCLSVFFIVLFGSCLPCPNWISSHPVLHWVYSLFAVSLCAQLGTAPLVAYYFHSFPLMGFISNLIAVPLVYAILFVAVLFFAISPLQHLLASVLGFLLGIMDEALVALSDLPGAVWELYPSAITVGLVYLLYVCVFRYGIHHKAISLYSVTIVLGAIFGVEVYGHRSDHLSPQIIFYQTRNVPAVHIIASSDQSYLWSNRFPRMDSALVSVRRTFWKEENIIDPCRLDCDMNNGFIYYNGSMLSCGGCRIVLACEKLPSQTPDSPLKVDYLLLSRGMRLDLSRLFLFYQPSVVILDSSLTEFYHQKYLKDLQTLGYIFYDMREKGALQVML